MLSLPHELILEIAEYIKLEWIGDFDDSVNEIYSSDFLSENRGDYYAMHHLYATCKGFAWMLTELECVCLYCTECLIYIGTRNINGQYDGWCYDVRTHICGYTLYHHGEKIKENTTTYDGHYSYRVIDGHSSLEECGRWYDDCDIEDCPRCKELNQLQTIIYQKDPSLKELHECDGGTVVLRLEHPYILF